MIMITSGEASLCGLTLSPKEAVNFTLSGGRSSFTQMWGAAQNWRRSAVLCSRTLAFIFSDVCFFVYPLLRESLLSTYASMSPTSLYFCTLLIVLHWLGCDSGTSEIEKRFFCDRLKSTADQSCTGVYKSIYCKALSKGTKARQFYQHSEIKHK